MRFCVDVYSFFLGTEVGMERLGSTICLGPDSRLFSRANASFYIPTHRVLNFQYLHILSYMHDHFLYFITDTLANDVVVHGPFSFIFLIWFYLLNFIFQTSKIDRKK